MGEVILEARDLSKSYANEGVQNHVLQHVDLDIREGDFTVIMGPSGSGKSTLLYCLSGMERANAGSVAFDGIDLVTASERDLADIRLTGFGYVFQQIHLVGNLTLLENVAVPGYVRRGSSTADVRKRAERLLDEFGLMEASGRLPSQASGGEQQRAAIARALINKPTLLFADEPTGALNRSNSDTVLDHFTAINREGQSILMVTHDVRAAVRGSRILYILDGRIEGELELPPFEASDLRRRETQVNSWLSSFAW